MKRIMYIMLMALVAVSANALVSNDIIPNCAGQPYDNWIVREQCMFTMGFNLIDYVDNAVSSVECGSCECPDPGTIVCEGNTTYVTTHSTEVIKSGGSSFSSSDLWKDHTGASSNNRMYDTIFDWFVQSDMFQAAIEPIQLRIDQEIAIRVYGWTDGGKIDQMNRVKITAQRHGHCIIYDGENVCP